MKPNGRPKIPEIQYLPVIARNAPSEAEWKSQQQLIVILHAVGVRSESACRRILMDLVAQGHLVCVPQIACWLPKKIYAATYDGEELC